MSKIFVKINLTFLIILFLQNSAMSQDSPRTGFIDFRQVINSTTFLEKGLIDCTSKRDSLRRLSEFYITEHEKYSLIMMGVNPLRIEMSEIEIERKIDSIDTKIEGLNRTINQLEVDRNMLFSQCRNHVIQLFLKFCKPQDSLVLVDKIDIVKISDATKDYTSDFIEFIIKNEKP